MLQLEKGQPESQSSIMRSDVPMHCNRVAKNPELRKQVWIATKVAGFSPGSETAGNRKVTLGKEPKPEEGKLPPVREQPSLPSKHHDS